MMAIVTASKGEEVSVEGIIFVPWEAGGVK
jgi:hypothetical protein